MTRHRLMTSADPDVDFKLRLLQHFLKVWNKATDNQTKLLMMDQSKRIYKDLLTIECEFLSCNNASVTREVKRGVKRYGIVEWMAKIKEELRNGPG